jgi:hypothetical protein
MRATRFPAHLVLVALLLFLFSACEYKSDEDEIADQPEYLRFVADDPFLQATRTERLRADVEGYYRDTPEPPNVVYDVAVTPDGVFAGTQDGLFELAGDVWENRLADHAIYRLLWANDRLYLGVDDGVIEYDGAALVEYAISPPGPVQALAAQADRVYLGATTGLFALRNGAVTRLDDFPGKFVADLAVDAAGALWIAALDGLYQWQDDRVTHTWTTQNYLLSNKVRALALDADGQLWIGTAAGLQVMDAAGRVTAYTGAQGLPYLDITRLGLASDGEAAGLWIGTSRGFIRFDGASWEYFAGRRWTPDDQINGLTPTADGNLWVATDNGLAYLRLQPTTLAAKARHYLTLNETRHNRFGLTAACDLDLPGDLSTFRLKDSNNDGLYTGLYLAALSFHYAVTQDPDIKALADERFEALRTLERVTGISGLPARSLAELHTYSADPDCAPFCQWQANEELGFDWKSDTGADEITGQFFGLAVYFDLVADDTRRQQVTNLVRRIVSYIIRNDYYLVDWDGEPTSTGIWNPTALWQWYAQPSWDDKLGTMSLVLQNSLAILAYLQIAAHVTGDEFFQNAYQELIADHALDDLAVNAAVKLPLITDYQAMQLIHLSYYGLLRYEPDETRRGKYFAGLERTWQLTRISQNSLFSLLYGALHDGEQDFNLSGAVQTLQAIPLDLVDWRMENSHRADVAPDAFPNRNGQAISDTTQPPLAAGERVITKWGDDPYVLDAGGFGISEEAGSFWLLAYWLGRYQEFIGD